MMLVKMQSAAVQRPALISECATAVGSQNIVLSMDIRSVEASAECPSGYEIVINGGRTPMGMDALAWAIEGERLGAGELVVNSIDADGTREGYELKLTAMIAAAVRIPVVASGGITNIDDIAALAREAHHGICGAVTGRAIYEGTLDVSEAQQLQETSRHSKNLASQFYQCHC